MDLDNINYKSATTNFISLYFDNKNSNFGTLAPASLLGFFMANFLPTYLVCYDIAESNRQAFFRWQVRKYSITGQFSAYECQLSKSERQSLIELFMRHAVLGEDACGIIYTHTTYWQNIPKSAMNIHSTLLYIG